eukprot:1504882-Pleurochrysis_carterae.AAC.1
MELAWFASHGGTDLCSLEWRQTRATRMLAEGHDQRAAVQAPWGIDNSGGTASTGCTKGCECRLSGGS